MLKSRMNIKALFVVILLGLVVVLLPQNYLGQSLAHEIGAIQNNTYSPLSLNFLRLWHPPRARKPKEKQATTFNSEAPPCEKTLLYRFAGAHGFASEFLIFLRVFLLARYFGFEVIIDDSSWNYGRWTE